MTHGTYDWFQAFENWESMPEISLVGILPDTVAEQVKLPTAERHVFIHRKTVEHIHIERGPGTDLAKLALRGVGEAVATPEYAGLKVETSGRTSVLCLKTIVIGEKPVLVAVKFVPALQAATMQDELWVSSAYPMLNLWTLRSMLRQGKLKIVTSS